MAGVRVPVIPMSHQYLVTQPFREHAADDRLPTLRDPDLLVYYREDGGGLVMGGYERQSEPAFLPDGTGGFERIPPDFNGRLLEDDWDRFEEITENSKRRVPVMDEITVTKLINGPEAFTPDNEFCLGETEVARLLRRRRLLRPRPRRRRRDRQGDGRVDRRGRAEPRPLGDGHPPLRRPVPLARLHPRPDPRDLRDLLRHPLSQPRAQRRAAAAGLAGQRLAPRARRRLRREVGLGAGQLVRVERRRRATSRCARAAGRASTGRRRSAPSTARPARRSAIFDETSFAKLEIEGPGRRRAASSASATTASPARSARSPTRRCSTAAAGSSATSPSRGSARSASRSSPAPPSATTTASGSASTCPTDGSGAGPRRHLAWACFGDLGAAGARRARAADPAGPRQRGLPLHDRCARSRSATSRCGRCGSPTSASSAGSSTARPSTGSASGGRSGRRASRTGSSPAATGRSTRCGSRRATGSGAPTSPPTRPRTRAASASASSSTRRAASSAARRWSRRRSAGPRTRLCCLTLDDPRSVALGNEPVRVGGEIVGRVTTGGYGYTVERSIAYAYLPPEHAEPGTAVEVEIFGELGRRRGRAPSRSSTPRASGSGPSGCAPRRRSGPAHASARVASGAPELDQRADRLRARSRRAGSPGRGTPGRWSARRRRRRWGRCTGRPSARASPVRPEPSAAPARGRARAQLGGERGGVDRSGCAARMPAPRSAAARKPLLDRGDVGDQRPAGERVEQLVENLVQRRGAARGPRGAGRGCGSSPPSGIRRGRTSWWCAPRNRSAAAGDRHGREGDDLVGRRVEAGQSRGRSRRRSASRHGVDGGGHRRRRRRLGRRWPSSAPRVSVLHVELVVQPSLHRRDLPEGVAQVAAGERVRAASGRCGRRARSPASSWRDLVLERAAP